LLHLLGELANYGDHGAKGKVSQKKQVKGLIAIATAE
jgi:hypothetical protein